MSENTENFSDPLPTPPASGADGSKAPDAQSDPYDLKDPDVLSDISERIDKCLKSDAFSRVFFEASWARNVFFFAGAQWLKRLGGRWEKRNLPSWSRCRQRPRR